MTTLSGWIPPSSVSHSMFSASRIDCFFLPIAPQVHQYLKQPWLDGALIPQSFAAANSAQHAFLSQILCDVNAICQAQRKSVYAFAVLFDNQAHNIEPGGTAGQSMPTIS